MISRSHISVTNIDREQESPSSTQPTSLLSFPTPSTSLTIPLQPPLPNSPPLRHTTSVTFNRQLSAVLTSLTDPQDVSGSNQCKDTAAGFASQGGNLNTALTGTRFHLLDLGSVLMLKIELASLRFIVVFLRQMLGKWLRIGFVLILPNTIIIYNNVSQTTSRKSLRLLVMIV